LSQSATSNRILDEHYREATFPADAKDNPYVYWLAGPKRTPQHSYCDSHADSRRSSVYGMP
jgi:hypothetical protein